jgi:hypothetical protein
MAVRVRSGRMSIATARTQREEAGRKLVRIHAQEMELLVVEVAVDVKHVCGAEGTAQYSENNSK